MKFNAILLILSTFLTGCDLFEEDCRTYCEDDVLHECSSGVMGGNDWSHLDCKKYDSICIDNNCVKPSDRCNSKTESICLDQNVAKCYEYNGNFYTEALNEYGCEGYTYTDRCVEINNKALCLTPVIGCNSEAETVCVDNNRAVCYKKDDDYYVSIESSCFSQKCIQIENSAYCATPVQECRPSDGTVCVNNQVSSCYKKNGYFYVIYRDNCKFSGPYCVEISSYEAKCLYPNGGPCDTESESICVGTKDVGKCYEKDGLYFTSILNTCENYEDDECVYDTKTKSAHCLSDGE
ncbi:MAG TPA: hypothetical protein PKG52_10550 [bacterium]|nr:hypothetical protein [bacterium]